MNLLNKKPLAWSIAGSDSGGGAGIQADLHTFQDFSVHGCTVITALTAQNSIALGYTVATERKNVVAQINALDSDLPADVIKLGMLANAEIVETVVKYLQDYQGFVVCDPVLSASTGTSLLDGEGGELLKTALLPRVDLLTPNVQEAELLSGLAIGSYQDMPAACERLLAMGARSVLITGGHADPVNGRRLDYWSDGAQSFWLSGEDISSPHNHGSGCSLSAAIAAAVARGFSLPDALVLAKAYVTRGIRRASQLGGGPGPVAHCGWPDNIADLPVLTTTPQTAAVGFAPCKAPLGLYPVVDSVLWLEKLLAQGVKTIQLRIKSAGQGAGETLKQVIEQSVMLAEQYGAQLFINDHWRLAINCGAYGVHLGQEDLESADLAAIAAAGLRLGVSTHSYAELARVHALQPSYIAIGPIFKTATKTVSAGPQGLLQLAEWVQLLAPSYPLTAIGGIDLGRAEQVLATGVGSCAVLSAISTAEDYAAVVQRLLALHEDADGLT